jgi:hypothetical protein
VCWFPLRTDPGRISAEIDSVFFELGRKAEGPQPQELAILSLAKIFTHTKLTTIEQVVASIDLINAARPVQLRPPA